MPVAYTDGAGGAEGGGEYKPTLFGGEPGIGIAKGFRRDPVWNWAKNLVTGGGDRLDAGPASATPAAGGDALTDGPARSVLDTVLDQGADDFEGSLAIEGAKPWEAAAGGAGYRPASPGPEPTGGGRPDPLRPPENDLAKLRAVRKRYFGPDPTEGGDAPPVMALHERRDTPVSLPPAGRGLAITGRTAAHERRDAPAPMPRPFSPPRHQLGGRPAPEALGIAALLEPAGGTAAGGLSITPPGGPGGGSLPQVGEMPGAAARGASAAPALQTPDATDRLVAEANRRAAQRPAAVAQPGQPAAPRLQSSAPGPAGALPTVPGAPQMLTANAAPPPPATPTTVWGAPPAAAGPAPAAPPAPAQPGAAAPAPAQPEMQGTAISALLEEPAAPPAAPGAPQMTGPTPFEIDPIRALTDPISALLEPAVPPPGQPGAAAPAPAQPAVPGAPPAAAGQPAAPPAPAQPGAAAPAPAQPGMQGTAISALLEPAAPGAPQMTGPAPGAPGQPGEPAAQPPAAAGAQPAAPPPPAARIGAAAGEPGQPPAAAPAPNVEALIAEANRRAGTPPALHERRDTPVSLPAAGRGLARTGRTAAHERRDMPAPDTPEAVQGIRGLIDAYERSQRTGQPMAGVTEVGLAREAPAAEAPEEPGDERGPLRRLLDRVRRDAEVTFARPEATAFDQLETPLGGLMPRAWRGDVSKEIEERHVREDRERRARALTQEGPTAGWQRPEPGDLGWTFIMPETPAAGAGGAGYRPASPGPEPTGGGRPDPLRPPENDLAKLRAVRKRYFGVEEPPDAGQYDTLRRRPGASPEPDFRGTSELAPGHIDRPLTEDVLRPPEQARANATRTTDQHGQTINRRVRFPADFTYERRSGQFHGFTHAVPWETITRDVLERGGIMPWASFDGGETWIASSFAFPLWSLQITAKVGQLHFVILGTSNLGAERSHIEQLVKQELRDHPLLVRLYIVKTTGTQPDD